MKIQLYKRILKNREGEVVCYLIFGILRCLLIFVPQFGYIHPDEFFQSVEVMSGVQLYEKSLKDLLKTFFPFTGDEFRLDVRRTWEFNATFPVRSVVVPFLTQRIPFSFLNLVSMYTKYYCNIELRTSYMLLIYPRLIMLLISFINDYCLIQICRNYNLRHQTRLMVLSTSYVLLIYGTRTFSNTIEMALCSILLYLVSDCMIHSRTVIFQKEFLEEKYAKAQSTVEKVKMFKLLLSLPAHSMDKCWIISNLCVIGIFNRPTFFAFGAPMVFHWLFRGMGTRSVTFLDFNLRMVALILTGIPLLCLCILVDSFYFHYISLAEINLLDVSLNNFVVTPLNFIKYNLDPAKTAEHGTHVRATHVLVNIPLLFHVLGVISIVSVGTMVYHFCCKEYRYLPRSQSFMGLMLSAILTPVVLLSFINHQEARFLLPITLPMVMVYAPRLKNQLSLKVNPFRRETKWTRLIFSKLSSVKISSKQLIKIWIGINVTLTLFYGFFHQGGVYQLSDYFSKIIPVQDDKVHIHLVTSYIYHMPQCFLLQPNTDILYTNPATKQKFYKSKRFFLYEYGSMELELLFKRLEIILKSGAGKRKHVYLAVPSSLSHSLHQIFVKNNHTNLIHRTVKTFYPHLSTEAMPYLHFNNELETDFVKDLCYLYDNLNSILSTLGSIVSLVHQFGLALYKIELK
jgi:GPI mannosyltransferase 4